jgi:ATP-dependent helicase HepA
MREEGFPSLPEDGLTATYNRKLALTREDFHFLTWEHPMVTGAMEQIINSEFGNTTFGTMKLPPLKAGTLVLEAIYTVYCPAPKKLQLQRYLPETMQRIVVGSNGMDMTNILKPEHISTRLNFVKKAVALNIIQHAKDTINTLVEKADGFVKPYQEALLETAVNDMKVGETAILNRLEALAAVNTNIRSVETDNQKEKMQQLERYLNQSQLKLDAVRLVLITD